MPFVQAGDGTRIHYRVRGRGPAVMMIHGLGADSVGWTLQHRPFAARHRVISVDNRGAGRSDKPDGPYSIADMVGDVIAVLDAVGESAVHVVGASMGGVIAQELAVMFPERVRSLVLACTAARHHPWRRELLAEWARVAREDGVRELPHHTAPWLFGPRSLRRFRPAIRALASIAVGTPAHAFAAQVDALLDMDDAHRVELAGITHPVLVLVGNQDVLTPRGDSEELAELIPHAELAVISGAAHGFMVEHARTFNRIVLDFIARAEARPGVACAPS